MEGASPLSDYSGEGLVVGTEKHIHVLCTVNSQMMLCKDMKIGKIKSVGEGSKNAFFI
jgi:hypothetical protein